MKLATLSSEFFSNYQPPAEFWPHWRGHFNWSANYVPLYQWENILFIGVCNWGPHPEIPVAVDGTKMIFLLAPADALSRFFANLQAAALSSADLDLPSSEISEDLVLDDAANLAPIQLREEVRSTPGTSDEASFAPPAGSENGASLATLELGDAGGLALASIGSVHEDLVLLHDDAGAPQGEEVRVDEGSQIHETENSEEKPDGLTMNPAIVLLAPVGPNAGAAPAAHVQIPNSAPSFAKKEAAPNAGPAEATRTEPPALESGDSKTLATSEPDLKPAKPSPEPVSVKPPMPTKPPGRFGLPTKPSSPPPFTVPAKIAPAKPAVAPVAQSPNPAKPIAGTAPAHPGPLRASPPPNDATAPASPLATATPSSAKTAPIPNAVPLSNAAPSSTEPISPNARVSATKPRSNDVHFNKPSDTVKQKVMDPLLPYYSKVMILLKNDTELNPWAWNNEFIPSSPEPHPVNLQKPSPFRIVEQTHKSYHGYVVDGEVQEAFFDNWNNSEVPDILTISPVVMQDTMVAAILGIGDKNINQKTSLQSCERAAEQLKLHLAEINTTIKSTG